MKSIYTNEQYFEAILQIRPKSEEILNFVKREIEKRGKVFISKEVVKNFGIDLYLTSQRFTQALGKMLKARFNGELKTSKSLHTRDNFRSKDVYRVTVLFRLKE